MYQHTKLLNGIQVLTESMPHFHSVAIGIFIGTGSRHETESEAGISHFLEHLPFKGTEQRPEPNLISGAIELVGGVINALTEREFTCYWIKISREHFMLALDVLADMVQNPLMNAEEIEKERLVILEELSMINDSPDSKAEQIIEQQLWPSQAMGRDIGGSKPSVSGISRQNLIAYHQNQYIANNTVVSVAGNISHEIVLEAVQDRFDTMPVGAPTTCKPAIPLKITESPIIIENRRTDQSHMCLAFPGVSFNDPRRYSVSLINTIIGEGQASRLFTEIRERNGLAYDISSNTSFYQDCGSVIIYCGVNPSKAKDALHGIFLELANLRVKVSENELKRAVDYTKGRMLLRFEDTGTVMSALGTQAVLSGTVLTPQEIIQGLECVTIDEIQHVAESLLNYQNYRLSIVGPNKSPTQFLSLFK